MKARNGILRFSWQTALSRVAAMSMGVAIAAWLQAAEPTSNSFRLYVSPDGKDTWSGKTAKPGDSDGPLASLAGAGCDPQTACGRPAEGADPRNRGGRGLSHHRTAAPRAGGQRNQGGAGILRGGPGARPIISGGVRITGFQPAAEKGLWQAKIPAVAQGKWYFEQLWVNGQRVTRARSPNKFWFYLKDAKETILKPDPGGLVQGEIRATHAWTAARRSGGPGKGRSPRN